MEDRLHWKAEDNITSANLNPFDPIAESFPPVGGRNREPDESSSEKERSEIVDTTPIHRGAKKKMAKLTTRTKPCCTKISEQEFARGVATDYTLK